METYLQSIESDFSLSKQKLKELTLKFQQELEIGLSKTDGILKALPTFVFDLPKGSELGKYLTVDLGGTNLRIGLVELLGSGQFTIKKDSSIIPDSLKCGSGKDIFNFIAEHVETFLEHPEIEAELPLKLGFTFSFPVKQESLAHGTILGWSKEIECNDVICMDAVALLQEALHSRGLDIAVEALVNDTVGTLLAQIYRDDRTRMSVILGTGSNAAYVEKCSHIPKLKDKINGSHDQTVINIEWGSFGDGPSNETILPITRFDHILDLESKNKNIQRFEKMISGMYLGEIFRLILVEAVEKGVLKRLEEAPDIHPYGIKTKDMSRFHNEFINENIETCKLMIIEKFYIEIQEEFEIEMLSKLCEIISLRSCYLCAVGITAVHHHLLSQSPQRDTSKFFSVALDGALYQRYPNYSKILQDLVCEMDTDSSGGQSCRVVLVMAEDLSSIGAAAAIAAQQI